MANSTTLSDRIASALMGSPTSSELDQLLTEAEAHSIALTEKKEKLRRVALHPTTPAGEVKTARSKIADAEFDAERLVVAVAGLQDARDRAKAREDQAARVAAYEAAKAERDAVAADLARIYPEAAKAIAEVLTRVARSNATIDKINAALPDGCAWLGSVELEVRGVMQNGAIMRKDGTTQIASVSSLTSAVRLPHLDGVEAMNIGRGYWGKGGSLLTGSTPASAVA